MNYTQALSRVVMGTRVEDLPPDVCEAAKKSLLDWIGVSLGAVNDPGVRILIDIANEMSGKRQSSVLGYGFKTTLLNAALVNGAMSHALDYDDAHSGVRTHPSAPMIPALLSAGEHLKVSGGDLIAALVAGFEVTVRIGYALGKDYYERGWHATSILGRFGAAAGAARLLGLDVEQTAVALGLAATQAGGLRDAFGTMSKPFHAGKAAMDGLLSALLAQKGFSGPGDVLNPESGFARVFTETYDPRRILAEPEGGYLILGTNFKPYAACLLTHPAIDGLIALRKDHGLEPGSIREVDIATAPFNLKVAGNRAPKDGMEAKFSLAAASALALIHGRATESVFSDTTVNEPRTRVLIDKILTTPVDGFAETEAEVKVTLYDGRSYGIHVTTPKGDPGNPMSFDEVADKTRDLTRGALSPRDTEKIVETVRGLEGLVDTARLVRLCCAGRGRLKTSQVASG